jgi:hypothetical protein
MTSHGVGTLKSAAPASLPPHCYYWVQKCQQRGVGGRGFGSRRAREWHSVIKRSYRPPVRMAQCCTAVIQTVGQSGTLLYGGRTDCRSEWHSVVRRSYRLSVRVAQCCTAVIQTVGQIAGRSEAGHTQTAWRFHKLSFCFVERLHKSK